MKVIWFLAGFGLGAVIGLLTAPQSGPATRRYFGGRAETATDFLAVNGRDYFERGRELYETGRHLADEASDLFDEGRRLMEKADAAESNA